MKRLLLPILLILLLLLPSCSNIHLHGSSYSYEESNHGTTSDDNYPVGTIVNVRISRETPTGWSDPTSTNALLCDGIELNGKEGGWKSTTIAKHLSSFVL